MKTQRNIAIIPARGGSKRLPRKNILPLLGKPLIEYTIEFAKQNKYLLHDIIVSTDDEEIKDIAIKNGLKVMDRPKELSGDKTSTLAVLQHIVKTIKSDFDNMVLLQVTNPLRPKGLLEDALKKFQEGNHDSLMTVSRNNQKFGKITNGVFKPFNYEFGQRSQDMEPLYFENGLLYISKLSLIGSGKLMGHNMLPYIVDHPFANIDIDEEKDMDLAAIYLEKYGNHDRMQ